MVSDKKVQIIEAATDLFAKKGFEGTSVRDIAASAEVNIAMINYYFGSKEKLFEAVMVYNAEYMHTIISDIAGDRHIPSIEKIDKLIDSHITRLIEKRDFHKLLHHEIMLNQREDISNIIKTIVLKNKTLVMGILEEGIKNGEFRKVDIQLTSAVIFGTINQLFLSRTLCNIVIDQCADPQNPFDETLKKRLSHFLKDLMHSHLLKK